MFLDDFAVVTAQERVTGDSGTSVTTPSVIRVCDQLGEISAATGPDINISGLPGEVHINVTVSPGR